MRDEQFYKALLVTVLEWEKWCFRRVDSIHFSDRDRGQQRHSIDCVPPPLPQLAYDARERGKRKLSRVDGALCVPLAMIRKGPMRRFDAFSSSGAPLPILGASEVAGMAVEMLHLGLSFFDPGAGDTAREALEAVVGPIKRENLSAVESFLATGQWQGRRAVQMEKIPLELRELIGRFVESFLLVALLPVEQVGIRQVLKLSFHLAIEPKGKIGLHNRILVAAGVQQLECEVPPVMPQEAASYHLEFNAPKQVDCTRLQVGALKETPGFAVNRSQDATSYWEDKGRRADVSRSSVSHVYGRFADEDHAPRGVAMLSVSMSGVWVAALVSSLLSALLVGLTLALPGAKETLLDAEREGMSALFLAAPAVLMGYLAVGGEHRVTSMMLSPLRWIIAVSSLSLFVVAASVVGSLDSPYLERLWVSVLVINSVAATLMLWGMVNLKMYSRK